MFSHDFGFSSQGAETRDLRSTGINSVSLYLPITMLVKSPAAIVVLYCLSCHRNLSSLVDFINPLKKQLEIGLTPIARCQHLAALKGVFYIA